MLGGVYPLLLSSNTIASVATLARVRPRPQLVLGLPSPPLPPIFLFRSSRLLTIWQRSYDYFSKRTDNPLEHQLGSLDP